MFNIPIPDYPTVLGALYQCRADRGEAYVYVNEWGERASRGIPCQYVHELNGNPGPGCIVGCVLYKLGVPLEQLSRFEGVNFRAIAENLNGFNIRSIFKYPGLLLLFHTQLNQDNGLSWGESIYKAKGSVPYDASVANQS